MVALLPPQIALRDETRRLRQSNKDASQRTMTDSSSRLERGSGLGRGRVGRQQPIRRDAVGIIVSEVRGVGNKHRDRQRQSRLRHRGAQGSAHIRLSALMVIVAVGAARHIRRGHIHGHLHVLRRRRRHHRRISALPQRQTKRQKQRQTAFEEATTHGTMVQILVAFSKKITVFSRYRSQEA